MRDDRRMRLPGAVLAYFAGARRATLLLWTYLVWYLCIVATYFDPEPRLWLNALGMSAIVGTALRLGVGLPPPGRAGAWQLFRLYATPFCVASFAGLTRNHAFWVVFPADTRVLATSVAACSLFLLLVGLLRRRANTT